jgi:hypothetical protein
MRSLLSSSRARRAAIRSLCGMGVRSRGAVAIAAAGLTLALWSAPALAAAPVIGEQSSLDVSATSATLEAQVSPEEASEVSYRFEYDTSEYGSPAAHGQSAPSPEGSVAAGTVPVSVEAHVQGLSPATVYHFRVVATNAAHEVAYGTDESFTTPVSGGEFALPDNRAWEMVSPVDKFGASVNPITLEGGVIQAAEDGSAITYIANAPVVANPEGNPAVGESQVVSMRDANGWSSRDIATAHEVASLSAPLDNFAEYDAFSLDLSRAVIFRYNANEVPLSSASSEHTIYLREGLLESGAPQYVPLVNDSNVVPGTHYAAGSNENFSFTGASSNLEHVVFSSGLPLTKGAEGGGLYEWTAGVLQPVSILPEEKWTDAYLGAGNRDVRNAVSSDGQRVFWGANTNPKHLYMRDTGEGKTVQLDLSQEDVVPEENSDGAEFQYAMSDGSKVYFTDSNRLTRDATAEEIKPELYEYNTLTGVLTDLTPNLVGGSSINVRGTVEVSENGEYVYFVADGSLNGAPEGECEQPGSPPSATCDLYVAHIEGKKVSTSLVAVLLESDGKDWTGSLEQLTSRVSPNGQFFAFMSDRSLTGYDNTDAVSGAMDDEVFVYDAVTKHLVCASCDPTSARPQGVFDGGFTQYSGEGLGLLVDRPEAWEGHWLAGSIPGWTVFRQSDGSQYQSRYLSNEGRLFFNSPDSLVPQDTNGKEDVYEYEPEGKDCGRGSVSASEVYKKGSGLESAGCIALISSGSSSQESAFLDASAKGSGGEESEDVFFLTSAKLSSRDVDTADDVYDAHVCSSAAPCATESAVSPACTTTDSCRVAPAAQPSIFGAPSSATFSGAGNVVIQPSSNVIAKGRALTRAQKLVAALKVCKKDRAKSRRVSCERRARKRYGMRAKTKKSIKGGK